LSFVGSFSNPALPNVSFVFSANLQNVSRAIADASAHEAGHEFGLDHQSQYSGSTLVYGYSYGVDDTAPLMGDRYYATRSLWWYGPPDASSPTYQNAMDVIASAANGFGYRTTPNLTAATALPLTVDGAGNVSGSGVIVHMTDLDYFSFTTGSGSITLNVNVP